MAAEGDELLNGVPKLDTPLVPSGEVGAVLNDQLGQSTTAFQTSGEVEFFDPPGVTPLPTPPLTGQQEIEAFRARSRENRPSRSVLRRLRGA